MRTAMLVSLNWLRDFVDLPAGIDPRELATQFTITTAEVEGVEHHAPNFEGLVAARIDGVERSAGEEKLRRITLTADRRYVTLSAAPDLMPGDSVVFAPPGAVVGDHRLGERDGAGRSSEGMIVAWGSLGFTEIGAHAIFLPPHTQTPAIGRCHSEAGRGDADGDHAPSLPSARGGSEPGQPIDRGLFDDWVIEIDNKSITHRPDCWGHYGIAREIAAMLRLPLRPYDVTPIEELGGIPSRGGAHGLAAPDRATPDSHRLSAGATRAGATLGSLPAIPIEIDDPAKCPRYTALLMKGLKAQPAPLWMQARLAMCGQRPIDLLVDLTNYVMLELGQPLHAFDGAKLANIQVATARPGEKFVTLDGVTRTMPPGTLMIQCNRKSVAIAGIMGGAETEVSKTTDTVLLESANFDAATIRRAATAMGHRTEASARFEKSLDPAHTVLGIARFHKLAKAELPGLELASALSDCYPAPKKIEPIELDCDFAARFIGKAVSREEIVRILTRLEFACEPIGDATPSGAGPLESAAISRRHSALRVTPPSFRATKDIEIEADLIEEIARFIGYNNIEPTLPAMTARHFERSAELEIEERTLDHFCAAGEFVEVQDYIWYDDDWLRTLGYEPGECITLRNPAAQNCSRLRKELAPGMLAIAERNRHHFERFRIAQLGTVFLPGEKEVERSQERRLALIVAEAGKRAEAVVWDDIRLALDAWARQSLESPLSLRQTTAAHPWEDADRLAEVLVGGRPVGRLTLLPLAVKQRIDERLRGWAMALAEIRLAPLHEFLDRHENLPVIPRFPLVRLDFSALAAQTQRYDEASRRIGAFAHPQLRRLSFVDAYEGGSIPPGKRSLTFRAEIGADDRTLTDEEIQSFRAAFTAHLASVGLELRM